MTSFQDADSALPGDIVNADTRLPGCQTANINSCKSGDGNGIVGTPDNIWNSGQQTIADENVQFWKHLALVHMISGISSTGDVQSSAVGNGGPADGCKIQYDESRADNFCAMVFMLKRG